jgi:prepilin signal peptidase PulO-like enzyme (type II secretory pathway)
VTSVEALFVLLLSVVGLLAGLIVHAAAVRFGEPKRGNPLLVSLMAAALFALASFLRQGDWLELAAALSLITFCLLLSLTDLLYLRVPNLILLCYFPLFLLLRLFTHPEPLVSHLAGGAAGFLLFFALTLIWPGAVGMGDVKLIGIIGFVLGWRPLLVCLSFGSLLACVAALALFAVRQTRSCSALPFVPFLSAGCLAAYFSVPTGS